MNTNFKSVSEAAAQLAGATDVAPAVEREIQRSVLISALVQTRLAKNMSQDEVAKRMNCNASKVCRMESATDDYLRLSDISSYAAAVGVQTSLMLNDSSLPVSARIKQCVLQIDRDLQNLCRMAQEQDGDAAIAHKISQFYQEVLFNFMKRYTENHEKLQNYIPLSPNSKTIELENTAEPAPEEAMS